MANDESDRNELGDQIATLLSPLVRDLQANFRACAEEEGLPLGDAQALLLLAAAGPLTTKDLAQRLRIDPANASTLVSRLERRGLLDRQPAQHDRRKRVTTLSAAGHAMRTRLGDCMAGHGRTFGRLTTDELITFRDLLRRLRGNA